MTIRPTVGVLAALAGLSAAVYAQVEVTHTDLQAWGTAAYLSFSSREGGVPAPRLTVNTGENVTWDLSGITSTESQDIHFAATHPVERDLLAGATHVWGNNSDLLSRRQSISGDSYFAEACVLTDDALALVATYVKNEYSFDKSTIGFLDSPDTLLRLPLRFGDGWSTHVRYADTAYLGDVEFVWLRRTVNSHGTLVLPGGESLPALGMRIVGRMTGGSECGTDSVYVASFVWYTKEYGATASVNIRSSGGELDTNYFKSGGPSSIGDGSVEVTSMAVRTGVVKTGYLEPEARASVVLAAANPRKDTPGRWTCSGRLLHLSTLRAAGTCPRTAGRLLVVSSPNL